MAKTPYSRYADQISPTNAFIATSPLKIVSLYEHHGIDLVVGIFLCGQRRRALLRLTYRRERKYYAPAKFALFLSS
ncbi:hypothetical protein KCP70_09065 [Salmonella enterica subsp. enterica]|nr:hypothetical protein KCP70_09065 [Salmonella enterica subsp. enterica]